MQRLIPFILLCIGLHSFSQTDSNKLGARISLPICYETLANFDFENQLKFDSGMLASEVQALLKKLEQRKPIRWTQSSLCGGWQAEALGSNWDGLKPLVRPNKRIVFEGDSVFIYNAGMLERATAFRLAAQSTDTLTRTGALLTFANSIEEWRVSLILPGEDVPWHGKAEIIHLYIEMGPLGCLCGCPGALYSQELQL